ncbi:MAG TPA: glycoside hydrolase, partial [Bacteroidetes bacterium]|nr:glycoside hydrolase [Bacteroidota bacterium]
FAGDFHTFTTVWDSISMAWYVDGILYYAANATSPFDRRFHMLLNVAVGGNWPGSPDQFTLFPQRMIVDYVRVYKKAN